MSGFSLHEIVRIVGCQHTADRACTRVSALRISAPMSWYSCLYTAVKNNARKRAIFSCYGKGAENCTSVRPSVCPSVRLSVRSSVRPFIRPPVHHKFHRATESTIEWSKLYEYAKNRRVSIRDESKSDLNMWNSNPWFYEILIRKLETQNT